MKFIELFGRWLSERLSFDRLMSLSDPKRIARASTVRVPPLSFDAYKDSEAYYFNVKSSPSTTGLRHKGYVRVFKPKNPNTPLEKVDCEVDCDCQDYRYRFAFSNKQRGSGFVGPRSLNQAWNKAPRITNPSGRPGLCVAEGEKVAAQRGNIPIESVLVDDLVWGMKGWCRVVDQAQTGNKEVFEVKTVSGISAKLTAEHPVWASVDGLDFEWIEVAQLVPGNAVFISTPAGIDSIEAIASISKAGTVPVYDLTVEDSHHFTVNGIVISNCKHLIATRDFIYGKFRSFASEQERDDTTVDKLDRLVKQSTKRWANMPAEIEKAKERDQRIKAGIERAKFLKANPSALPQLEPSKIQPPSPLSKTLGAKEAGISPEGFGSEKAGEEAGEEPVAAWRARRSEESLVVMSKTMFDDQINLLIEEQEMLVKNKLAATDEKEDNEILKQLREIKDILKHIAGDDLPPDMLTTDEDNKVAEVEPGIPVDAAEVRDQS